MPDEKEETRELERDEDISDEIEQDPISEQVAEDETLDTEGDIEAESDIVEALQVAEEPEEPVIDPEPEDEDEAEESVDEGIEIVVDGEKKRVASKAIWDAGLRTLQKESAADRRLELAEQSRREAEEALQKAKNYSEAIKPSPEQARIIREVAENFEMQYPVLAADERLKSLVIGETDKLLAAGNANDWTTYQKAATTVKHWHEGIMGIKKTEQDWENKRNRKAAMAQATIIGVGAKNESMKVEPKPQTNSDIILEMRKARGQAN